MKDELLQRTALNLWKLVRLHRAPPHVVGKELETHAVAHATSPAEALLARGAAAPRLDEGGAVAGVAVPKGAGGGRQ